MPTIIAIESKNVTEFGIRFPFEHLYLVKRTTDAAGNVIDERVIRGNPSDGGALTARADIPLALSDDARGDETLVQRHHRVLNLGGRDPDAVWNLMVQHARNINLADLNYSLDITGFFPGADVNSNTVIGSALHAVGIDIAGNLPRGITARDVPLYNKIGDMIVNDLLLGGAQADRIFGGVGSDRLEGRDGNDRLYGEAGVDALVGGSGNDAMIGGTGPDRMRGGLGSDVYVVDDVGDRVIESSIDAAAGIDRINATVSVNLSRSDLAGVEKLQFGGTGDVAGRGNSLGNVLLGNRGDNRLSGGSGDDTVAGGSGDDRLFAGPGNDSMRGGPGRDTLDGGQGQDVMSGGTGADVFVFKRAYESPAGIANDLITDFSTVDILDLHGIDADATVVGNQAFVFIRNAGFSDAGQLRFEQDPAGNTLLQADVNGDLAADFQVTLRGYMQAISRGDFIL